MMYEYKIKRAVSNGLPIVVSSTASEGWRLIAVTEDNTGEYTLFFEKKVS